MQNVIYSMTPFKITCTHYSFPAGRLHIWKSIFKELKSGNTNSFKVILERRGKIKKHIYMSDYFQGGENRDRRRIELVVMNVGAIVGVLLALLVFF